MSKPNYAFERTAERHALVFPDVGQRPLNAALGAMETTMDVTILAAAVIAYLQHLGDERRATAEQRVAARNALSEAFHETEGYYAALSAGAPKDPGSEHRISHLWERAAIASEHFDRSLSSRLGLKSRYWREGAAWSDSEVAAAKIQLESVRRDGNFALIRRRP